MSKTQQSTRVDELGNIFVSVTGDDSVTESQDETAQQSDRELPDDEEGVDVEDGLDDAVAGSDVGTIDPVS